MTSHLVSLASALTIVCAAGTPAAAQESRTVTLAEELVTLLEQRSLDAAAARIDENEFAAVYYIPDVQILAVSGEYAAPALMDQHIASRNYTEAYRNLVSASAVETRVRIDDTGANGLRPSPRRENYIDVYTAGANAGVSFDGEYESRDIEEAEYRQTFSRAEAAYTRILEALLQELKKES